MRRRFIKYCTVRAVVLSVFIFSAATANSQGRVPAEVEQKPRIESSTAVQASTTPSDLLDNAKSFRDKDPAKSAKLTAQALEKAEQSKQPKVAAQAHSLLAKLSLKRKDLELAKTHFLAAAKIFLETGKVSSHIQSSIDYVKVLVKEKRYDKATEFCDELLSTAMLHGDNTLTGLVLQTKGSVFYKQKLYQQAIDTHNRAIEYQSGDDLKSKKILASTYHELAQSYKHLNDIEMSVFFFKNSLQWYKAVGNQKSVSRALKNIASAENSAGNYVSALDYAIRSLEEQKDLNDSNGFAEVSMLIGIIYRNIGNYEKSLEHFQQAYRTYESDKDITGAVETGNQIGMIYTRLKQYEHARSFYQESIDKSSDDIAPLTLATAYREIAVIDSKKGKFDNAIAMLERAEAIYVSEGLRDKRSLVLNIIGKINREKGNIAAATEAFEKSLAFAEEGSNLEYQIRSLNYLASIHLKQNPNYAIELLLRAMELGKKADYHADKLWTYTQLKQGERLRGNLAKALYYADLEIGLIKEINTAREQADLVRAKAKLDSHKKEIELDKLREKVKVDALELAQKKSEIEIVRQANTISELELTKNRYANSLLVVLLVFCIAAAVYIYRIFVASRLRNKELDYLAARDPLTNCFNRRVLFERLKHDFEDIELFEEYSIILADIDFFKRVNDTHGHSAGDSVLRGVASILQDCIRQNDIVARYGGEEFCIILPGAGAQRAIHIAEFIRSRIEATRFDDIGVTCSLGVSSLNVDAKQSSQLIDQADKALYKSKDSGRNRVTLWQPEQKP